VKWRAHADLHGHAWCAYCFLLGHAFVDSGALRPPAHRSGQQQEECVTGGAGQQQGTAQSPGQQQGARRADDAGQRGSEQGLVEGLIDHNVQGKQALTRFRVLQVREGVHTGERGNWHGRR